MDLPLNFSCHHHRVLRVAESSGLLEDRANGVWQDGSHRRRAEADNAKLVLEDRGSDTTTPLNWNLKSIRGAPHPFAQRQGEKKGKRKKKRIGMLVKVIEKLPSQKSTGDIIIDVVRRRTSRPIEGMLAPRDPDK